MNVAGNLDVEVKTSEDLEDDEDLRVSIRGSSDKYRLLGEVEHGESKTFAVVPEHLWWPYTMNDKPGFLHTLKVPLGPLQL